MTIHGIAQGLTIGFAGLGTMIFYYAVGAFNLLGPTSPTQTSSQGSSIFTILAILSLILVLVASRLRINHEQSDTARLMGGIVGSIFLISTLILIIQLVSSPGARMLLSILLNMSGRGMLITFTWIIIIICGLGFIASGILAVINFARLPTSESIAYYSFKIGIISLAVLVGWLLLLPLIIAFPATAKAGST